MTSKAENTINIESINISPKTGTVKKPVDSCEVDLLGIKDDAHRGMWHRQISLLDIESVKQFEKDSGLTIASGEFGENITTRGIDLGTVAVLDRFIIGSVELEITQIGKKCHGDDCAIYRAVGKCIMPKRGLFARVIKEGTIHQGDPVTYRARPLSVWVLTLSDRASKGVYKDTSGPAIESTIKDYFSSTRFHLALQNRMLPDDPEALAAAISECVSNEADFIFTTGGTGIGPRDIAPDVVSRMADKTIPGIMDHIRIKYGAKNPNALLSRSIAACIGKTAVFTMPGSTKAVMEYMHEIVPVLQHSLSMMHGIGH